MDNKTEIDTSVALKTAELAELMMKYPELFHGRVFTKSTLSTYAGKFLIPARQLSVTRKALNKVSADIIIRSSPGNYIYMIAEILDWCRLGADRTACVEVIKKRESSI